MSRAAFHAVRCDGDTNGLSGIYVSGPLTVQGYSQSREFDNGLDTDAVVGPATWARPVCILTRQAMTGSGSSTTCSAQRSAKISVWSRSRRAPPI